MGLCNGIIYFHYHIHGYQWDYNGITMTVGFFIDDIDPFIDMTGIRTGLK